MDDLFPPSTSIPSAQDGGQRVQVLVPLPVPGAFDYAVPAGMALAPGDWVAVPFGSRMVNGVVWADQCGAGQEGEKLVAFSRLKLVSRRYDGPALAACVIAFVDWVARYTLFPPGAVLRMVMRSGDALSPPKGVTAWRRAGAPPSDLRLTPQRAAVMAAVSDGVLTLAQITRQSGAGGGVVRGLAKAGALERVMRDPDQPFEAPDIDRKGRDLSTAQADAARQLVHLIETHPEDAKSGGTALLDGVTGSGKTEVYLEAVRAALAKDPTAQVLVMLPEIGLTMAFLKRIEARFGAVPAGWHSDIGSAARRRVWRRVLDGQARLVVGARSALFLPFRNLQLIIVDEEHDGAYKQEDGVLYQARDMAVVRGAQGGFPVILASATPSLETMINAAEGRFRKVTLPSRYGSAQLPDVSLIDMRKHPPERAPTINGRPPEPRWLSPVLVDGVSESLVNGEQALLFLNRRGYAPLTICRKCGHRMKSPQSDTCLVEHRFENRLVCHHTGYSIPKPDACPKCNTVKGLSACGPGVERIADEARARWPHARVEILSSDRVQGPAALRILLEEMRDGAIDILVATQAAAKGHNFPKLTMVGVVDADLGLAGGDLRAAERTYQLLSQVAGRAGRADRPGRAMLQTYQPDAPVLRALINGDRDMFLAAEAEGRIQMLFPPFGRIAGLILRGRNEQQVRECAQALRRAAPPADGVEIWGPAPAPIYRLNGEVRIRMLVRARRDLSLQAYLKDWTGRVKIPAAVRRIIDIDPYSFM